MLIIRLEFSIGFVDISFSYCNPKWGLFRLFSFLPQKSFFYLINVLISLLSKVCLLGRTGFHASEKSYIVSVYAIGPSSAIRKTLI